MITIPPTSPDVYSSPALPFVIIQYSFSDGIQSVPWDKDYYDSDLLSSLKIDNLFGLATFRCYAKGQNPQSLKRAQS